MPKLDNPYAIYKLKMKQVKQLIATNIFWFGSKDIISAQDPKILP
jgi:hypothetical protein